MLIQSSRRHILLTEETGEFLWGEKFTFVVRLSHFVYHLYSKQNSNLNIKKQRVENIFNVAIKMWLRALSQENVGGNEFISLSPIEMCWKLLSNCRISLQRLISIGLMKVSNQKLHRLENTWDTLHQAYCKWEKSMKSKSFFLFLTLN